MGTRGGRRTRRPARGGVSGWRIRPRPLLMLPWARSKLNWIYEIKVCALRGWPAAICGGPFCVQVASLAKVRLFRQKIFGKKTPEKFFFHKKKKKKKKKKS